MACCESLAGRIRDGLARTNGVVEKRMFGGIAFLRHGRMIVGVWKDSLAARVGRERAGAALRRPHVGEFDAAGRPMKDWVLVHPDGLDDDRALAEWIGLALSFAETLPPK